MTVRASLGRRPVPATQQADAVSLEFPKGKSSYVLIVDDEAVVREFLTRCLEADGYAVKQVATAAEALQLMMSEPAAAVLCDIRMPGQDGLWLAERLHTHWPHIPIVMASAIDDVETMRKSRETGAVDYVTKPIEREQLLEVVRRVTALHTITNVEAIDEAIQTDAVRHPDDKIDAEYVLEAPVRCPACGERVAKLKAVRLIRAHVNFMSTLPRRGRVVACPHCLAIVPAELTNF